MEKDLIKAGEMLRASMRNKIKELEFVEKMRQEKELEERERQIIRSFLLRGVYAPVLNDFYSRF